jgi:hypothetical protein
VLDRRLRSAVRLDDTMDLDLGPYELGRCGLLQEAALTSLTEVWWRTSNEHA